MKPELYAKAVKHVIKVGTTIGGKSILINDSTKFSLQLLISNKDHSLT